MAVAFRRLGPQLAMLGLRMSAVQMGNAPNEARFLSTAPVTAAIPSSAASSSAPSNVSTSAPPSAAPTAARGPPPFDLSTSFWAIA